MKNIVARLANKYMAYKQKRILAKSSTRIIFLDIPFYSIPIWKRKKGHPNPDLFNDNQIRLENAIMDLNKVLKEINDPILPPHITQDMYYAIKRKASQSQTRKISYALLLDGIHPGKPISHPWLIRLKLFSCQL